MTAPRVFLVLRQSLTYTTARLEWLRRQVTDVDVMVMGDHRDAHKPLRFNWPGWWSKLELCDVDRFGGDVFFMDLDTVVLGPVAPFATVGRTTFLSDFYRPERLQSSVFYMTEADRARVWEAWMQNPQAHIARFAVKRAGFNGDQNFMDEVLQMATGRRIARWQDTPEATPVCSYKVDVVGKGHRPRSGLLIFHGKPRPWTLPEYA